MLNQLIHKLTCSFKFSSDRCCVMLVKNAKSFNLSLSLEKATL